MGSSRPASTTAMCSWPHEPMKPRRLDHFPWRPGRAVFFPEPDDIEVHDAMCKGASNIPVMEALRIASIEANIAISVAMASRR